MCVRLLLRGVRLLIGIWLRRVLWLLRIRLLRSILRGGVLGRVWLRVLGLLVRLLRLRLSLGFSLRRRLWRRILRLILRLLIYFRPGLGLGRRLRRRILRLILRLLSGLSVTVLRRLLHIWERLNIGWRVVVRGRFGDWAGSRAGIWLLRIDARRECDREHGKRCGED